ncbi:hypothetical protein TeGR_g5615 [Tetraparma gracilis]|uniref:RNI-like protein n=1 Tax=Tetraparma gracilis TaxID=2962635 RepID=A0ABQ6MGM7_9STRA|nr:hypothetical protein TeGR_g5615 [Tetraparma gracilis]
MSSIPDLATLSYHALLQHISHGHAALQFRTTKATESEFSLNSIDDDTVDHVLHDASKRRLLTDSFILGLCLSGTPPKTLSLKRRDIDVVKSLKKQSHSSSASNETSTSPPPTAFQSVDTYSSATSMLFSSLTSLSLDSFNELLFNDVDANSVLHSLARASTSLTSLSVKNSLHEVSAGSLKAVSAHCKSLQDICLVNVPVSDGSFLEQLGSSASSLKGVTVSGVTGVSDRELQVSEASAREAKECPSAAEADR